MSVFISMLYGYFSLWNMLCRNSSETALFNVSIFVCIYVSSENSSDSPRKEHLSGQGYPLHKVHLTVFLHHSNNAIRTINASHIGD